jgi:hypothetical protein
MPEPVLRNSPALYSVPLHFIQEYDGFAISNLPIPHGTPSLLPPIITRQGEAANQGRLRNRRYTWVVSEFQLVEVAVPREVFRQVLERIAGLYPAPG